MCESYILKVCSTWSPTGIFHYLEKICVWIIEKSCERGPVMCHLKASINVTVGGYDEENVPIWSDQDTLITRYTAKSSFLTLINNFESDFIVYQSQAEAGSFVSTGQISIEIYRCAVLDLPIFEGQCVRD